MPRSDLHRLRGILATIAANRAARGESDLSPDAIVGDLRELEAAIRGESDNVAIVIDHTDMLLRRARALARAERFDLACVFYATWVEHRVNGYVSGLARRSNVPEAETEQLIRGTTISAKLVLLHLVGGQPVDQSQRKTVNRVSELRNSFVHYKWKPQSDQLEDQYRAACKEAEESVRYFRTYERECLGHMSRSQAGALARGALDALVRQHAKRRRMTKSTSHGTSPSKR